ncbi:MAG TPA: hypothetical protein VGB55_12695 [Tepidisphaeraceae bacterium]|jgi:hypothetical protein
MIRNTTDSSAAAPALRCYLNLGNLGALPAWSTAPRGDNAAVAAAIKAAGYDGIQCGEAEAASARAIGLGIAAGARFNAPAEIEPAVAKWKDAGFECATAHLLWGLEDDATVDALVGALLNVSAKHDFPIYIETHRATITQDIWRTVQLVKRHPDVRFNGDFSHWYTGHEMRYGDFDAKLELIQPVFDRVRFIHGRIGSDGCMQVDIGDGKGRSFVDDFRQFWTRSFAGFLKSAKPGDYITFAPELLGPPSYARTFPGPDGQPREESDRWQQALLYCEIARACFAAARQSIAR